MSLIRRNVNDDIGSLVAGMTIAANATTAFDFGTPNDIDLRETPFKPGDRILVALTATRASGTSSSLSFTIQDAPDSSGSIGTPATADIDGTLPSLATDSGAVTTGAIVAVLLKPDRPWLRINAVHGTAGTDSFTAQAVVMGIPPTL